MADFTKVPTSDIDRYTEGYYYLGPPWGGSTAGEYSQDELRAQGYTTISGNGDFAQNMIRGGKLVPRLYSQAELASWGGPPGGFSDYQSSLWGTNPSLAEQQFLANVPMQYRATSAPILSGGETLQIGAPSRLIGSGFVGPAVEPISSSGGIILDGEITRSSLPTRELSERVAGAGGYTSAATTYAAQFGAPSVSGGGLPSWIWIAAAAVAVYLLVRES